MGTGFLKKIAVSVEKKQDTLFTYPVTKQQKYVAHFPEPRDGIERGYFQYCCQMKLYGRLLYTALNMAALPLSWRYMMKFRRASEETGAHADAVFFDDGKPFNIIPDVVQEEYKEIVTLSSDNRTLNKADKKFLKKIFRKYPFSWLLRLKLILKIAQYSYAITKYDPRAIISCSEYSFTSPFLTEYCHTRGVKLINVMHGEKMYEMKDAFSKFDEFYVWDQAYVDLLCDLRADKDQFRIAVPQSLRIEGRDAAKIEYDYTYYLAAESVDAMKKIAEALKRLHDGGKKISVRPHPRYSDAKTVSELFGFANIEDARSITIERSLLQTGTAVSLFSTVLNQAQSNSIPIVIDDISNPAHFEKLKELRFACMSREHKLLSQVVGEGYDK